MLAAMENREFRSPSIDRVDWALLAILCLVASVVMGKDLSVGGLRFGDTSVHAMDGVLIHDWIAAGPQAWVSPMSFAERQYGQYPCLGIGRHYPPGFAMVEAAFFGVLGISPVTARLSVVFFALLLVVGTYLFVRQFSTRTAAVLSSALLVTLPEVTLWGRQTMLEVPTLAVLSWGAVTFCWYLRHPTDRRFVLLLIVALSAILFRQTSVFLVGAVALTLFYCAWLGKVPARHWLCCALLGVLAIVGVLLSFEGAGAKIFRGRSSYISLWDAGALTFYLRQLPRQVGWVVLVAAGVGVVVWPKRLRIHRVFLVLWFVVSYIMVSSADLKCPRFFFVGLFPIAMFAGMGMWRVLDSVLTAKRAAPVVGMVVVIASAIALGHPVEHRPDYGVVVAAMREKIQDKVVLVSGLRDTHFVFAVRQHIPRGRAVVVRGSKLLYTCSAYAGVGFESYVSSVDDIDKLMDAYAFDAVFVERVNKHGVKEDDLLVDYLRSHENYNLAGEYALQAETTATYRDTTLDMYEPVTPITRQAQYLDIPIPRSGKTIRIDLADWTG